MRRKPLVAVLATGLALLLVSSVAVSAMAPPGLGLFIAPGATAIHVQSFSIWEQQITYRAADTHYGWYMTVGRNLGEDGWSAPVDNRVRLQTRPDIRWRIRSFWFVYLKEQAALQGDPDFARITVSRELIIPWRQYPRWFVRSVARWFPGQAGLAEP